MTTDHKSNAGELLRQGRLRQRLSIAECAKRTHIASRYIEALEDERWADLPSESHRLGFLKLYSRFLGVPVEDILSLYRQSVVSPVAPSVSSASSGMKVEPEKSATKSSGGGRWSPNSVPQIVAWAILLLLAAWLIYHAVIPRLFEQNPMPWARRRPSQQARLSVPKASVAFHKVRLKGDSDGWLRVTSRGQLLFEGILPAGSSKEWTGAGPFQLKIGNIRALSLFWNDQPVDITVGARGDTNEIRIPPQ